uniref:Uncharacterized protein n=1 Tax=Romanomermis culicivorax TaxID=13658 RepID=A0A915J4J7_ROMCU
YFNKNTFVHESNYTDKAPGAYSHFLASYNFCSLESQELIEWELFSSSAKFYSKRKRAAPTTSSL